MTDKKAYVTLREATQEAEKIAQDPAIPLWKKAHLMGIPFTKIALNELKPKDLCFTKIFLIAAEQKLH